MLKDIKSLAKHSSIYGISNLLLQKGIGFIMIPVYTHYLTVRDYGILELMDLTVNVISMLMGIRLGSAIIRYYHHYETPDDKLEVFSTALIFVFFTTIAVVAILEFFTKSISGIVLGEPKYFRYFQILFVAMGLQTIVSVFDSYLLAKKQSVLYSGLSICNLTSNLTLNILFIVVYRMEVMGMLLSMLITKTFSVILLMIINRHNRLSFSWEKLKKMLIFGLPLVPESFCLFIMHYSDRFFVRKFCALDQLGQYSLGYKFGMILSFIISEPFFSTWNTQRFEIAKREDAKPTFGRFFTYYSAVALCAGLGISVFIDEVIRIMAPKEYQGATAVVALVVLSSGRDSGGGVGGVKLYFLRHGKFFQSRHYAEIQNKICRIYSDGGCRIESAVQLVFYQPLRRHRRGICHHAELSLSGNPYDDGFSESVSCAV